MRILVTGGTGSFGQALIRRLLEKPLSHPQQLVVFSRDELKQHDMRVAGLIHDEIRYFLGDVRDVDRLRRAFNGVDIVVHAAALKQVESCEFNPLEAKKTNIDGTQNVIDAALDCGVRRVLMIGTDKAVDPVNLYGKTKAVAEHLMIDANAYSGADGTAFSCTRYGNVITSRGAVLPRFFLQHANGEPLTVTDPSMTRFVLTLNQGVEFVVKCLTSMRGGEVFVPKLPTIEVGTIVNAVVWPKKPTVMVTGRRPGEKQHEALISRGESVRVNDRGDHYVIYPVSAPPALLSDEFVYSSETALPRLDVAGFRELAGLGATLEATG